ncbi:sodium/hydrogen exchanger 9-like [Gordionus sp. m RMFG-2023]|uniref:sodium/hydrogen exchanger 9-like n=1 Tax=Gordionus sp. m RMFG-2023 TaxID=3053472 RepID=UPI0031FCEB5C
MSESYDIIYEELVKKQHILDSLNLLIFNVLLIFALLTVWLFKHRRIPYLHETGLALIYGLIAGAVIKYGLKHGKFSSQPLTAHVALKQVSKNYSADFFPTNLLLSLHGSSVNFSTFAYKITNRALYGQASNIKSLENTELENKLTFDPEVFFNVLLPPIIFNAGYSLNRANFFNNIGTITTFAFVGTVVSAFVAGSIFFALTLIWPSLGFRFNDCLFFGATISATDPVAVLAIFSDSKVDSNLYSLVFGESVLNDAIAMVLALTIDKYVGSGGGSKINFITFLNTIWRFCVVFMGSLSIGFCMGFITAIMTKFTKIRDFPLLETSLFFLMSYSTFLIAEVSQLSGIVAVLFAGIFQAHYTYHNLSKQSQYRTRQIYELMSFLIENFIFSYIGVSLFTFQNHKFHMGLIVSALIAIFISRLCNIYPLSFLLNLGRNRPIPLNTQHMLMFSGLRGAMAFALAIRNTSTPQRRALYTTTSVIVIITVLFCGSLTPSALSMLKIKVGSGADSVEDNDKRKKSERGKKSSILQIQNENDIDKYQKFGDHDTQDAINRNVNQIFTNNQYSHDAMNEEDRLGTSNTNVTPDSYSHNFLVRTWGYLDYKLLKPLLTQTQPSLMITLPKFWYPIARIFTTTEQMRRHMESHLINTSEDTSYYGTTNINTGNFNNPTISKSNPNEIVIESDDPPILNVTNIIN